MDAALCIVRAPDVPLLTLASFMARHAVADAEGKALAMEMIGQGVAVVCDLADGRRLHLVRRGIFVSGTPLPVETHAREACLDAIGARMAGRFVPGGTVDLWLAPLPTGTLAAVIGQPCARWPELLLSALGRVRTQAVAFEPQALGPVDMTHVTRSPFSEGTLMAWATCRRVRALLDAGEPVRALEAIRAFSRLAANLPPAVGARFAGQLDRLFAEAEALRARQRAHEVA